MKPYQLIGYSLSQTTAITALVSTRIYHGLRPASTVVPCINYYEVGSGSRMNGLETTTYSINCRASTASAARNIAKEVLDLFHGNNGKYGSINGFDVSRSLLRSDNGIIPEPEDKIFNAPIDVSFSYPLSTVS